MALWKSSALFNKDSATLMAASALLLSLEWQGDDVECLNLNFPLLHGLVMGLGGSSELVSISQGRTSCAASIIGSYFIHLNQGFLLISLWNLRFDCVSDDRQGFIWKCRA